MADLRSILCGLIQYRQSLPNRHAVTLQKRRTVKRLRSRYNRTRQIRKTIARVRRTLEQDPLVDGSHNAWKSRAAVQYFVCMFFASSNTVHHDKLPSAGARNVGQQCASARPWLLEDSAVRIATACSVFRNPHSAGKACASRTAWSSHRPQLAGQPTGSSSTQRFPCGQR